MKTLPAIFLSSKGTVSSASSCWGRYPFSFGRANPLLSAIRIKSCIPTRNRAFVEIKKKIDEDQ